MKRVEAGPVVDGPHSRQAVSQMAGGLFGSSTPKITVVLFVRADEGSSFVESNQLTDHFLGSGRSPSARPRERLVAEVLRHTHAEDAMASHGNGVGCPLDRSVRANHVAGPPG